MMLHQHPHRLCSLDTARRGTAARRALPTDAGELERTMLAAASSSNWAWTTLTERFGARLRGVARRHGLGPYDVEDVAQATWLRLLEHIDDVREPAAIGGWLETTARRESLRVLRCGSREQPTGDELDCATVEPVDERRLVATEQRRALRAGVEKLPDRQRELIAMMLAEPAPEYAEISQSLGIPHGSIGPTRQRGLARLRADGRLVALCQDEAA